MLPTPRAARNDLLAGLTSGIAQIPDAMASGVLARLSPIQGLYAVIAGTPVAALAAGSVLMAVVPTGALSVATGEAIGRRGGDVAAALATLTVLVGVFQLAAGLLRFGVLVRFVSDAVMTGFLTGIGTLIVLGQLGDVTGYRSGARGPMPKLIDLLAHLPEVKPATLLVGLVTMGLVLGVGRTRLAPLSMLLGLAGAALLTHLLRLHAVALVGDETRVPRALPSPVLPSLALVSPLALPALGLAVIGLVQGAGVSQSWPNRDGRFASASRDFAGQGAANLVSGLLGGMPIGGSLSATALVAGTAASGRLANVFLGLFVAAGVLILGPVVELLPVPALAGMLVVAGVQTIRAERIVLVHLTGWRARLLMLLTFAATLVGPLQLAVLAGVVLSLVAHLRGEVDRVTLKELALEPRGLAERDPPPALRPGAVTVLLPYGSLFFAGARTLEAALPEVRPRAAVLLLLRGRADLGSTLLGVLVRYSRALAAQDGVLLLVGVSDRAFGQLERTRVLQALGRENVFRAQSLYGESLLEAWSAARRTLGPELTESETRGVPVLDAKGRQGLRAGSRGADPHEPKCRGE